MGNLHHLAMEITDHLPYYPEIKYASHTDMQDDKKRQLQNAQWGHAPIKFSYQAKVLNVRRTKLH
jgi:putative SOS response-associated peptidase YedK